MKSKRLTINDGYDVGVIPSSLIVQMLRRKRQASLLNLDFSPEPTITVGRIPEPTTSGVRGRSGQIVGTILIGGAALYILIHLIIWWVKT